MSTAQQIGVPSESRPGETRVAATPKTVEQLRGLGYEVVVESGAGALASFADAVYEDVPDPLSADDVAEAIVHATSLPPHVNLDLITIKPVAQAAPYRLAKGPLRVAE